MNGDGEALADEVDGEEVLLDSPWDEEETRSESPQQESGATLSADDDAHLAIETGAPELRELGHELLDTGLDEATLDEAQDEEDPRLGGGPGVPPSC
ncbi:MAG: hypothetical protein U0527_14250 [Candidatus Eisenbacteria bacterium]